MGAHPLHLLSGPLLTAVSDRAHDRLSDAQLAEWYLRWRELPEVPEELLKTLRLAPEYLSDSPTEILRRRGWRLAKLFTTLEVFQAERRSIARRYLESAEGQETLQQQLRIEVERRAQTLEAEVKTRRSELAEEEQRLAARRHALQEQYRQHEHTLAEGLQRLEARRAELQSAAADLGKLPVRASWRRKTLPSRL